MIIAWNCFVILGIRLKTRIRRVRGYPSDFCYVEKIIMELRKGRFKMRMVLDHLKTVLMKNFANAMELMMPGEYKRHAFACFHRV